MVNAVLLLARKVSRKYWFSVTLMPPVYNWISVAADPLVVQLTLPPAGELSYWPLVVVRSECGTGRGRVDVKRPAAGVGGKTRIGQQLAAAGGHLARVQRRNRGPDIAADVDPVGGIVALGGVHQHVVAPSRCRRRRR